MPEPPSLGGTTCFVGMDSSQLFGVAGTLLAEAGERKKVGPGAEATGILLVAEVAAEVARRRKR